MIIDFIFLEPVRMILLFQCSNNHFRVVLHPGLRSKWFETLGTTLAEQQDAWEKAEAIFRHVAQTYSEEQPEPEDTNNSATMQKSAAPSNSFLSGMLAFDMDPIVSSPRQKETIEQEVARYLRFEGSKGEDPLPWWKVCLIAMIRL